MLLELVSGKQYEWLVNRIAHQPSRLEEAQTLSGDSLPSDDSGVWGWIEQLLTKDASSRPSMDIVQLLLSSLQNHFAANTDKLDRKFRMLTAHLSSIRQSTDRTSAHLIQVQ